MTRARWAIALALGMAALAVGADALITYVRGGLVVGVAAVAVLMAILVLGLVNLARARRHLGTEVAALAGPSPAGTMAQARQQRLRQLHASGASPDLDALADATAAEEAERAFAGKYLVATTVLIGLVGTFGGLMETLGRLPPLLNAETAGSLALLTGPLAGLAVTFGASVVAILVTLSLSLAQGDVTLHQERALAALEERTRHVLVPALWPLAESAPERAARELAALRTELGTAMAAGAEAGAKQIASVTRAEFKRLVDEIGSAWRASATSQAEAITRATDEVAAVTRKNLEAVTAELKTLLGAAISASNDETRATAAAIRDQMGQAIARLEAGAAKLTEVSTQTSERMSEVSAETTERLSAVSERASERLTETSERAAKHLADASVEASQRLSEVSARTAEHLAAASVEASQRLTEASVQTSQHLTEVSAQTSQRLTEASVQTSQHLSEVSAQTSQRLTEVGERAAEHLSGASVQTSERLSEVGAQTSTDVARAATAVLSRMGEAGDGIGQRLETASAALSEAAAALQTAVAGFTPAVGLLAPQLSALSQEVALLAARAETQEQPNAVLDELIRLGEDVERLIGLARPALSSEEEERA